MLREMRLVDEFENVYYSAGVIGQGGQGIVLRTRDSDIAVKLVADKAGQALADPTMRGAALKRLRRLRVLPLPADLPLARPVATLRDGAGYVMRLLDAMSSFKDVFERPCAEEPDELPHWLAEVASHDVRAAAQLADYAATGSTKSRLLLLAKCATVLARLHAAGLVYGDLSTSNVFTNGIGPDAQVWLIDADNVHYEDQAGDDFFTEWFAAPELERGDSGVSFRTDCHAFAVTAFSLLCLNHPFVGDLVREGGDWSREDADPQLQARHGRLPWIHDADESNRTDQGLPPQLTCSPRLAALFEESFGPGRTAPWRRPAMLHWPEALAEAADCSLHCGACGMSYFALNHAQCPYCGTPRPRLLRLDSHRWPEVAQAPCWVFLLALDDLTAAVQLPSRVFMPFGLAGNDEPVLSMQVEEGGYRLRRARDSGAPLQIARTGVRDGQFEILENFHLSAAELAAGVTFFAPGAQARLVRLALMEAA
jgi:ribosomal protein L37E